MLLCSLTTLANRTLFVRTAGADAPFVKSGVIPALIDLLSDDAGPIRHLAVSALATLRDEDAQKALIEPTAFEKILELLSVKHDGSVAAALLVLARLMKRGTL